MIFLFGSKRVYLGQNQLGVYYLKAIC